MAKRNKNIVYPCLTCGELAPIHRTGKCKKCRLGTCIVPGCGVQFEMSGLKKKQFCRAHGHINNLEDYLARKEKLPYYHNGKMFNAS